MTLILLHLSNSAGYEMTIATFSAVAYVVVAVKVSERILGYKEGKMVMPDSFLVVMQFLNKNG